MGEHIAHETEAVYYELLALQNAPRTNYRDAGYSLAHCLLHDCCFNLGITDNNPLATRGLSLLKVAKVLVATLAGNSIMTWMGTEFAQIDHVDMPRQGNGFNEELSKVRYDLADDANLRFKQMETFEARLNHAAMTYGWLADPKHEMISTHEEDKFICYSRGGCVFVFNLHPVKDLKEYAVQLPFATAGPSTLACVLNTDDSVFGGSASSTAIATGLTEHNYLKVNLPARTAAVFAPSEKYVGA